MITTMGPFGEGIAQYRVSIRFDPVKFQSADFERMVDSYHQITQEVRMSDDDDANRGMYPERSRVPLDVDDVYSKYGGTAVKFTGEEYLVLSARDPLAVSRENRENFGVGIENVAAAAALSDGEFNAEHELGLVFDADPRSAHYRSLFPRSAFPATVVDVLGSGGNVREVIATSGFDALLKVLRTGSLNRGHDVELVPGSLISIPTPDPPPELLTAITHLVEHFADDEASTDQKITDALEATHVLPASAHLHALRAHESAWRNLEQEYRALSAAQIGALRESTAKNRAAYASQLRTRGQVIGVQRRGTVVFPLFQFDKNVHPLPGMKDVVSVFREANWSDDSICLWMIAPNGRLSARKPADLLATDPSDILEAAKAVTTEW